jgi:TolB-like protein
MCANGSNIQGIGMRFAAIGALVLAGLSSSSPALAGKVKIAVIDLVDKGVGQDVAQNLTDVVTVALNELGVLDVLSRSDIQRMLEFETQKQLVGCESDTSCLAEIGGALGVALLISGSVGKVGASFIINLTLTDTETVTVESREQRQVPSEDQLTAEARAAARFLVRALLAGQQGHLVLTGSESDADVEIDGRIVGVTPLARQTLAGGPHTLKVVKKGFVTWAKDIDIEKDQTTVVDAAMVPSLEFIEAYDSKAGTWRTLAYIAGGAGAAGLAFGIGGWVWNGQRAAEYERDLVDASCQRGAGGSQCADPASFESRRDSIERFDLVAQVAGWTGAVALGVGVYLFTQGPRPGIYDRYKPETSVSASVLPTDGGATGFATFTW